MFGRIGLPDTTYLKYRRSTAPPFVERGRCVLGLRMALRHGGPPDDRGWDAGGIDRIGSGV